jgi:hypothetical protein
MKPCETETDRVALYIKIHLRKIVTDCAYTFKEWCAVEGIEPTQEQWNSLLEMLGLKGKEEK